MVINRRDFLLSTAAAGLSRTTVASGFSRAPVESSMKFGYAAITWGADVTRAIDDISSVGFRGIQLRSEAFAQFGDRPAALRDLLARRNLTLVALSSGNLSIDPAREASELAAHLSHAKFMRDAGGLYLQVIDERPKGRPIVADDYRRLGRILTQLGQRTADLGVPLVYHHHMNSLGERPEEVAAVLDAADRRYVKLLFDVAHYQQGGGDPVPALQKYKDWLQVLHLKDVEAVGARGVAPTSPPAPTFRFVELGRGRVDLAGVFAALAQIKYNGWAVVELDRVPDPNRTPKECAENNKRFLTDKMNFRI
jgi:inosose dehydratase